MTYHIAVRSYDRSALKRSKTINTLRAQNLLSKTTVFVVEEQMFEYTEIHPDVHFALCEKGCANANKSICNFFPVGTPIVFMDDDLDGFYEANEEGGGGGMGRLKSSDLETLIESGFSQPLPWTVGFMSNTTWMIKKPIVESRPAKLNGSFFAMRNDPEVCIVPDEDSHNEDIIRTCKVLNKYKQIFIFNHAMFRTVYGMTSGGITKETRNDTRDIVMRQWCEYESIGIRKFFSYKFNEKVKFYDFKINNLRVLLKNV